MSENKKYDCKFSIDINTTVHPDEAHTIEAIQKHDDEILDYWVDKMSRSTGIPKKNITVRKEYSLVDTEETEETVPENDDTHKKLIVSDVGKKLYRVIIRDNMHGKTLFDGIIEGYSGYRIIASVLDKEGLVKKIRTGVTDMHHGVDLYDDNMVKIWFELELDSGAMTATASTVEEQNEAVIIRRGPFRPLSTVTNCVDETEKPKDDNEDELVQNLLLKKTMELFNTDQFNKYPVLAGYVMNIINALTTLHGFANRRHDADSDWHITRILNNNSVSIYTEKHLSKYIYVSVKITMGNDNIVNVSVGNDLQSEVYSVDINFNTQAYLVNNRYSEDNLASYHERYGTVIDVCVDCVSPRAIGFKKLQ